MRTTDIFNPDFSRSAGLDNPEILTSIMASFDQAKEVARTLERAVRAGSRDEHAWRLLSCLYLGAGDVKSFNELDARHEEMFGFPIFLFSPQPKPERDPRRRLIEMPARLEHGSISMKEILAACDAPQGAAIDFSRVRGADPDGLDELLHLLKRLPRDKREPELPGFDRFVDRLQKAAESRSGSEVMWEVLLEYRRYRGDASGYKKLAERYAKRHGKPAPSWEAPVLPLARTAVHRASR